MTTAQPTQRVQLWTPDPALNTTNAHRRPLTPCPHLLELQRRSAAEEHNPIAPRFRPPSHHHSQARVEVASLLDICAQAILLHQHRQRTRQSSSTAHNAPSSGRHHHWAEQKQKASLSVATTVEFDVDLLPQELRAYLSEHWLCVVCQRPTRGQQKCHTHNSHHHNNGRLGANYPGWCPSCVQRLCYCQADGCQACNSTWLCLTCGKVCCSTSSHEHSFDHSMMESHMLAWKVGPRPFEQAASGAGDPGIWCFACSRYVGEAKLHRHLQTLGLMEPNTPATADSDVSER